jgi:hypothetical protein
MNGMEARGVDPRPLAGRRPKSGILPRDLLRNITETGLESRSTMS